MKRIFTYIVYVCLILVIVSCEHKELCYLHSHTAKVTILSDWSQFKKETPSGMTVVVYPQYNGEVVTHLTHTIDHATPDLPVGIYNSIIFNQSVSEFGTVSFRGMDAYETAEVYANGIKSSWYKTRAEDERVVTAPEWIGTSRHEAAVVTEAMKNATSEDIFTRTQQQDDYGFIIAEHSPQDIIYTITVTIHIKGFQNLYLARASLDGLSEGYNLGIGKYSQNAVTQLLEDWEKRVDETDPTKGTIQATITCFGLPDGHTATPDENLFCLSLLLVDRETIKDYMFSVGDKFVYDEDSATANLSLHLNLTLDEPLPSVKPAGGSSNGFNATVDDWGEEENYEIEV